MQLNLNISKATKIYIACPANIATGGPELLNQLCKELRNLGFESFIYYLNTQNGLNPTPNEYLEYNNPYVEEIVDTLENIIIVGEKYSNIFVKFHKIQKVIWWLSIDNYYVCVKRENLAEFQFKKTFSFLFQNKSNHFVFWKPQSGIIHFVQSEYAKSHLLKFGVNPSVIYYLSDYINTAYLDQVEIDREGKKNVVLYSPAKGLEFTKRLIEYSSDIQFTPLKGLTRKEMMKLFNTSKVYIDFGNHPGKDRIPREAALSDLCIITNKMGSANFFEDVSIPSNYKFKNYQKSIVDIYKLIQDCLFNYEHHILNFKDYKAKIIGEKGQFQKNVREIFCINREL